MYGDTFLAIGSGGAGQKWANFAEKDQ